MTNLREKMRGIVASAKDDMVSLDDATNALMTLVQPVATDEVVEKASQALWDYMNTDGLFDAETAAQLMLTAALSHAVTRDDVLEELEREIYELGIVGMRVEHQTLVAEWLRSRKGGA